MKFAPTFWRRFVVAMAGCLLLTGGQLPSARADAMLQLFNVSYADIIQKMPELAEAGYNSLWLPPPTKGSGGLSVGYDLWDPFDLGSKDQRGSVRTRYGTEAELLHLMEVAHRFGIRVYFDNIMNHRAFDVPGYNENTAIDIYPGMVPEDFHLRKTEDGFYRKWDNTRDWNSAWQVQNLGLADLIDIAHETPNTNHGPNEGDDHPKYPFVRDYDRPEQYDTDKNGQRAYFGVLIDQAREELGAGASESALKSKAQEYINARKSSFTEDVGAYLIRAVRWKMDRTKADGLRLDAVKHVPDYFFGLQSGAEKNSSNDGYLGGVQWQFDRTRGFGTENANLTGFNFDANKRDSVFEDKRPRNDSMVFGEHLGQPPGYGGYWDAGMRLVDNDLRSQLNNRLGSPGASLSGLDQPGWAGAGWGAGSVGLGVAHANSHDSDYAAQKEWQHAFYMTREGMGLIYSDGYNKAETLGESGGAFPRHANTAYLGQFGDPRIPNILKIHNDFARGLQEGRWADSDYLAFERRDNRNPDGSIRSGNAADEITMVMMMNDNTAAGQARALTSSFPSGAYLYQYAEGPNGSNMTGFYKPAGELNTVVVPPGGYFLFSYRTPELSTLWPNAAITLYQTNASSGQLEEVPRITVTRKDGRDGDQSFNPYGLPNRGYPTNATPAKYTYQTTVPVVKGNTPFTILARADGSAENILLKLDGGVDLNGSGFGTDPGKRDNPPGLRTDVYLGYEQPLFADRQHPEKFAAKNTARCQIGSPGAETYVKTIGGSVVINDGQTNNFTTNSIASFHYHDPEAAVGGLSETPPLQFVESASNLAIWSKTPSGLGGYKMFVYYTTNGTSWPEGAGGIGRGATRVAEMNWRHDQTGTDPGSWWSVTNLPAPASNTQFRYKIGVYRTEKATNNVETPSWWPGNLDSVTYKKMMMTTFRVADFNPATAQFFPHNDYARKPDKNKPYDQWDWAIRTNGLAEGFHVLRARAFLPTGKGGRSMSAAPLYQTFVQTFYYDAQTPQGEIIYPGSDSDTVVGSSYDLAIRTDSTVEEVWYRIDDSDSSNDDSVTKAQNGNGIGFEPFVDANANGVWNAGETFTDLNGNGIYDASLNPTWAKATEVTPSLSINSPYRKEWRFTYNNIPLVGSATITVRLLEASSSRNFSLPAVSANATDLNRSVQTRGNAERLIIAYPTNDGDSVDDDYVMKVWFPKSLSNTSITESQMINRFTFLAAGNAVDRGGWSIDYGSFGPAGAFHQLSIPLPNLYNSALDRQEFRMIYQDPADANRKMVAVRYVVVKPSTKPFMRITQPTEVGSDGKLTEIILPDNPGTTNDVKNFVVQVETSPSVNAPTLSGIDVANAPTAATNSTGITWSYPWRITNAGTYNIGATALLGTNNTTVNRTARVIKRQIVDPSGDDFKDDDNDGLLNIDETSKKPLPTTGVETWKNGDVHVYYATGRSLPTSPDSDGDGLPDGLEVGWRTAGTNTATNVDSNGDGIPNFVGDLDPPLYAVLENAGTVPGVGNASQGDDRSRQAAGSMTDPTNPDTDGDGLPDGAEDADVNGWTDGDGKTLQLTATIAQYTNSANRPLIGDWPNNNIDSWETWQETAATKSDSDGDSLSDGYGEDKNTNGRTDIFLKSLSGTTNELLLSDPANAAFRNGDPTSRSINYQALFAAYQPQTNGIGTAQSNGWPRLLITETDPLKVDTDGDGLPDGWESNNGLNALDDGNYNFVTGEKGDPNNGANGDPDEDGIVNSDELANGTLPNYKEPGGGGGGADNYPGEGSTGIGKFTDWTYRDLLVLDEYNENGNQGADVYRLYDGFDASRDIVAFSFKDGGAKSAGGDGRVYFRVDFMDLVANGWEAGVDVYIAIDTGNPSVGERALPNNMKIATDMRWEAVVAAYGQNLGSIFVDLNRSSNSISQQQNPLDFGVKDLGFGGANEIAWSSRYDAVEIAIDRKNLIDAGWLGDPNTLNFQVFTTKPNTQEGGAGNIAGRNNITDTVYDDWISSDYWKDQSNINLNGKLAGYFGRSTANDRNKYAKVMLLAHANQAIQPASVTQSLIQSGPATNSTGYARLIQTHKTNNAPLTLHITPTLASALQWAKSTVTSTNVWPTNTVLSTNNSAVSTNFVLSPNNDGPSFNNEVKSLVATTNLHRRIDLVGSTFSDHIPKYFQQEFNNENKALAENFLDGIYGANAASRSIFWAPERVLDTTSLSTISGMNYGFTFADQMKHFVKWFGRTSALGVEGYRLNEVNGIKIFPIHDVASGYLDRTLDEGSTLAIRQLLSRRSRSNVQDQVVVLWKDMGDFADASKAASYDANVRWLSSRPWVRVITAQQIAGGQVQYRQLVNDQLTEQLTGNWGTINRGPGQTLTQTAKDWIDWASGENYDHWYYGRPGFEAGLRNETFGTPTAFGYREEGHARDAWMAARSTTNSSNFSGIYDLAGAVIHSAMFQTAFHNTPAGSLEKFSTGAYIYPDNGTNQTLAPFARHAQSQARFARIYARVKTWAESATASTLGSGSSDVDLDGASEYFLFNSRIFALFEARGGRMTAAWLRDTETKKVWQVAGNFASYSNTDNENEGADNATAYRTSGFKDWWGEGGLFGGGNNTAVNAVYTPTPLSDATGWQFIAQGVTKRITLDNAWTGNLTASYTLNGPSKLFVRFGLSPNLLDLMLGGQSNLGLEQAVTEGSLQRVNLLNNAGTEGATVDDVRAFVKAAKINALAKDTEATNATTERRRNQAQTHQVEVELNGAGPHIITLGFDQGADIQDPGETLIDGIPDSWWSQNNITGSDRVASNDPDNDGLTNMQEYILGSDPNSAASGRPAVGIGSISEGYRLSFPTQSGRNYQVQVRNEVSAGGWEDLGAIIAGEDDVTKTYDDLTTLQRRFYRVQVSKP